MITRAMIVFLGALAGFFFGHLCERYRDVQRRGSANPAVTNYHTNIMVWIKDNRTNTAEGIYVYVITNQP